MSKIIRRGRRGTDLPQSTINELFKREVSIRVSTAGNVRTIGGRLVVTATRHGVGHYTLHAPAGWQWWNLVGGGEASVAPRIVNCGPNAADGHPDASVRTMDGAGTPSDFAFRVVGTLIPG